LIILRFINNLERFNRKVQGVSSGGRMDKSKITIDVPENVPISLLKRKINELVKEEALKWALFEKCKEELSLTDDELKMLEKARDDAWKETKKKYGL